MKNIQGVSFLRNGAVYESHALALAAIENNKGRLHDGEALLARYNSTENNTTTVKTLFAIAYVSGATTDITTFDLESASSDVAALRTEINNKLGSGITSENTATAQLEALSGNNESTSGETSVAGAKAYAKDYADSLKTAMDYTGITTSDAAVVTNVTEADGIVAATSANVGNLKLTDYTKGSDSGAVAATDSINAAVAKLENQVDAEKAAREAAIDALDYTDTAVTKQFVAAVNETNGVISITRGELQSSGKTINITADGNNVNFEANVDGTTIIIDENTGTMSVASSALVQYEGDEKTIHISEVENAIRTVSSLITLSSVTPSSEEVKEEYALKNASGETIGSTIKIYKDSHIVSINYIKDPADPNYQNLEYVYIDASGNTQTTYVDMSELVLEAEFASGVTITNHIAHGVVDPTSETFLTVGAAGFKLSGVQDAIDSAVSGLDATVSAETNHVTVKVDEVDGKLTAVTLTEDNIANATDLAALSGKTLTEVESSNSSISATTATTDGTVKVDIITDASKIKMTGFTAAETSGFTAITTASTVTEAVKAIETEMISNEQTTAAALNDLEAKIEELSGGSEISLAEEIANRQRVDGITGSAYTATAGANYISDATSLNDADQKLDAAIDNIADNYVSGITVNGSGVTVTNNIAALDLTSATSATTATGNEAITVATDEHGNITLGLAYLDCGTYDDEV